MSGLPTALPSARQPTQPEQRASGTRVDRPPTLASPARTWRPACDTRPEPSSETSPQPAGQCVGCQDWTLRGGSILSARAACLALDDLPLPKPAVAVLTVLAFDQALRGACPNQTPWPTDRPDAYRAIDLPPG